MNTERSGEGAPHEGGTPDIPAYNDEFTRDFIKSSEEVEDGFYLFESLTKGYSMLFPVDAEADKAAYERNGNAFESFSFLEEDNEANLSIYYRVVYENQPRANDKDVNLRLLSSYTGYDGDYDEYKKNDTTYYYAEHTLEYKGKKTFQYFAYIKPSTNDKAASFVGDITCLDQEQPCNADSEEMKQRILKIMHSIEINSR
ncbi:hypothetical protein [Sutcliffiella horikoshii]|uniref:hypothetical protein n=1 Tax=Sutcliffiella horikoshii TaxID=79883 RepID=UPI00384E17C0